MIMVRAGLEKKGRSIVIRVIGRRKEGTRKAQGRHEIGQSREAHSERARQGRKGGAEETSLRGRSRGHAGPSRLGKRRIAKEKKIMGKANGRGRIESHKGGNEERREEAACSCRAIAIGTDTVTVSPAIVVSIIQAQLEPMQSKTPQIGSRHGRTDENSNKFNK